MLGEIWIDHRLNLRLMEIEKRLDGIEFDFIFHKVRHNIQTDIQ